VWDTSDGDAQRALFLALTSWSSVVSRALWAYNTTTALMNLLATCVCRNPDVYHTAIVESEPVPLLHRNLLFSSLILASVFSNYIAFLRDISFTLLLTIVFQIHLTFPSNYIAFHFVTNNCVSKRFLAYTFVLISNTESAATKNIKTGTFNHLECWAWQS